MRNLEEFYPLPDVDYVISFEVAAAWTDRHGDGGPRGGAPQGLPDTTARTDCLGGLCMPGWTAEVSQWDCHRTADQLGWWQSVLPVDVVVSGLRESSN